ncbi:MAG TPA: hypothetical protein VM425_22270 [Myxococcota bacterium]|nr:hypothetical protein [Myxococcota bacterium]
MSAGLRYMGSCLVAILTCSSCDVFLPADWGQAGMPCHNDSDCNDGNECSWNKAGRSYCVPWDKEECASDSQCKDIINLESAYCGTENKCEPWDIVYGFGDECQEMSDCDEEDGLGCICFLDEENCYCTTITDCSDKLECVNAHPGSPECMQTGYPDHPSSCGRPAFTGGVGVPCEEDDDCSTGNKCVSFEEAVPVPAKYCTENCGSDGDCPWGLECEDIGGSVCAFRDWLGFNRDCPTGSECSEPYNTCYNSTCTRTCQDNDDCPKDTTCDSGHCTYFF